MRCQELQTIRSDANSRRKIIPAQAFICSILLHALVMSIFLIWGSAGFRHSSAGGMLSVRLLAADGQGGGDSAASVSDIRNTIVRAVANLSEFSSTSLNNRWESSDLLTGMEEGYLPQEFLSRTAFPVDDIDLQDISSPEEGVFQMYLWIDSRGRVTRVDVQDSNAADWFVDQIVERFKKSRFTPGLRGDKPVAAIMHVEVVF